MALIQIPKTVYAGEATDGSCISSMENFKRISMNPIINIVSKDGCTIVQSQRIEVVRKFYRKNFTLTCINGSTSHNVTCITTGHQNEAVLQLQGKLNVQLAIYVCKCIYSVCKHQ